MKILLAGDIHGNSEWCRTIVSNARANDCRLVIQLGDFGFWSHKMTGVLFLDRVEQLLADSGIELWWVDGNHENHQLLRDFYGPTPSAICPIRDHISYLPRGYRFDLDGLTFLCLGGAASIDRDYRVDGESWWREELIDDIDVHVACRLGHADVMLTHDCPIDVSLVDLRDDAATITNRTRLQQVVDAVSPRYLFHGHYHMRHTTQLGSTTVIGLSRDGDPDSLLVLDLEELAIPEAVSL